jgi:hypothetical protein
MGRRREEVSGVSGIEPREGLRSRRVETKGVGPPQQVLGCGEGTLALACQEHLRDVRRTDPVEEPAAVKPARPVSGSYRGAQAEQPDLLQWLVEHRYRLGVALLE